jgi:hypothetical protein
VREVQQVVTLSTTPVVIAPLISVDDQDKDDMVLVNITTPKYGTLKFLSCCNSYYLQLSKNVTDYM